MNNLDQNSRRNNIEIKNIPEKIKQSNLGTYVLELIGVKILSYELVVAEFAFSCLRNSKKLSPDYKNLHITICPCNKKIFNYLYVS